jgi:hypothetical protein
MDKEMKVMIGGTMRMLKKMNPEKRTWKEVKCEFAQNGMVEAFEEPVSKRDTFLRSERNWFKLDGSPDVAIVKELQHVFSHPAHY